MYTVGSLFAGVGGFDLAFTAAGFNIAYQVEIDDYCQQVLSRHWPDVPKHKGVCEVGAHNLPSTDVICGGFPCTDISLAGKRAGIEHGTRSGLWFEMARIIGELRPRIVLLENVAAIITAGGGGTRVIADLAEMGYDARWGIIRASDAGAPHQRARWFCVGNPYSTRLSQYGTRPGKDKGAHRKAQNYKSIYQSHRSAGVARRNGKPNQSRVGRDANGLFTRLDSHRWPAGQGYYQHSYEPPRTVEGFQYRGSRVAALGNAVVPQVVYPLAVMIREWLDTEQGKNAV